MSKALLVLFGSLLLTACQTASMGSSTALSAGALSEEYEKSGDAVRSKYNGKEIIVRGYTATAATMPRPGDDQGALFLKDEGHELGRQVTCWFSKNQTEEFSKIKAGQDVTVKGIFNGEAGVELKFCRIVKVE